MEAGTLSVKQFNELVNALLQEGIGEVTISGEISGYQVRQGKWVSFELKDKDSVLSCFTSVYQVDMPLEDGQEVLVTGTPRIYVPYGKYSLNVRSIQLQGEGALKKAFEELKNKLAAEGLFAPQHKRPLPRFPQKIGIITSGDGAAINDIRKVIDGRWGGLELYLVPVLVQGKNAPDDLVNALHYFNEQYPVDVIIFGRGGGSLEDLQAFNSERVARAIFSSRIPIVAGIGHEHNTSIADLVADVRAATPSNAAEIAVPDREAIRHEIELQRQRIERTIEQRLMTAMQHVQRQKQALQLFIHSRFGQIRLLIQSIGQKMTDRLQLIQWNRENLARSNKQLTVGFSTTLIRSQQQLMEYKKLLLVLSPEQILKRGYSITFQATDGKPITCLADVPSDGRIRTRVSDGSFDSFTHEPKITASQPTLF